MRKPTIIFILLSGLASFLNYAIYPVLSRVLSPEQFVDITVALALFTQLSSFMLSIVALTIGVSKESSQKNARILIEKLQSILAHLFIVIIGIFLIISPFLLEKLSLSSALLLPICIMLALSLVMSIVSGYLNGRQELVRLGVFLAASSALQFIACITVGIVTKNGVASVYAMATAAFVSVVGLYVLSQPKSLPDPRTILLHKLSVYKERKIRKLLVYTVCASLSALAINLLIVLDLLVISKHKSDAVLYADMYIISRVVFFSGMLLVWPFLSQLNIRDLRKNVQPFFRLSALFLALSVVASLVMYFFGHQILAFILGSQYIQPNLEMLAVLSISYKLIYLINTTLCLVFMVIRSYWAVTIAFVLTALSLGLMLFVDESWNSVHVVSWLNGIGIVGMVLALYGSYRIINSK